MHKRKKDVSVANRVRVSSVECKSTRAGVGSGSPDRVYDHVAAWLDKGHLNSRIHCLALFNECSAFNINKIGWYSRLQTWPPSLGFNGNFWNMWQRRNFLFSQLEWDLSLPLSCWECLSASWTDMHGEILSPFWLGTSSRVLLTMHPWCSS